MPPRFFKLIAQPSAHFIQFMLDQKTLEGTSEKLTDYIAREKNYDLAFINSFLFTFDESNKSRSQKEIATCLLSFLDEIHDTAISHRPRCIPRKLPNGEVGYEILHGIPASYNYYGLTKDWNSDEAGIEEIIKSIFTSELDRRLIVNAERDFILYQITKKGLSYLKGQEEILIPAAQIDDILQRVKIEYQKGDLENELCRLVLVIHTPGVDRYKETLKITLDYIQRMKQAQTDEEKIKSICVFMCDLMQIHRYLDGNGRAQFMFANRLLHLYDLPPFYPSNLCLFDGNSHEKVYQEVIEGQKTFKTLFKSLPDLINNFTQYKNLVVEIEQLIQTIDWGKDQPINLKTPHEARDFNLLFRRSSASPHCLSLFKLLLNNANVLNINIYEKGLKSGSALDIANQFHNQEAINELRPYIEKYSAKSPSNS